MATKLHLHAEAFRWAPVSSLWVRADGVKAHKYLVIEGLPILQFEILLWRSKSRNWKMEKLCFQPDDQTLHREETPDYFPIRSAGSSHKFKKISLTMYT